MEKEKVIKSAEICLEHIDESDCPQECPYFEQCNKYEKRVIFQPLIRDALALLKEQEAVEPTLIREGRNKYYNDYVCPRCDNAVVYEQNYCSECGIPFLWEGR